MWATSRQRGLDVGPCPSAQVGFRNGAAHSWSTLGRAHHNCGALMYVSQVGPDQAVSNLSQWAVKFGINDPPQWLKAKSTDRLIRRRGAIALAALLVITIQGGSPVR
jgi:hypothetical protein